MAVAVAAASSALAAGANRYPSRKRDDPLAPVEKALDAQDYERALARLETVLERDPDDADAWNLRGFAARKLGRTEAARAAYDRALALDPKHRRAHEYLGELHLQTGDLASAKAQLAVLDDLCWLPCSEERQLRRAIEAYEQEQNNGAPASADQ